MITMMCSLMKLEVMETKALVPTPLLFDVSSSRSISSETTSSEIEIIDSPPSSRRSSHYDVMYQLSSFPFSECNFSYKSLSVLSGHVGSVSCLALCGEFILSASPGRDIIVWKKPDLKLFTKFGQGDGSVKAIATVGNKVFTGHQDRVWKVSTSSDNNVFKHVDTLPTRKDYLGKFLKQSNYVQTRRHHKHLWIEHADSISCLTVYNGFIYSGSWDKTLKIWRLSDLKCLESINAHDDAINGIVACKGVVYSSSADGRIKAWGKEGTAHSLRATLEGQRDMSMNSVVVSEDGKWVYGGGSNGFVLAWEASSDFKTWKFSYETKAHDMSVLCMCLMGEFIFSGSADKSIGIWKRESIGKVHKVGVLHGHGGPVKCLQASSHGDGVLIYSGSLDKTLRNWWVTRHTTNLQQMSQKFSE